MHRFIKNWRDGKTSGAILLAAVLILVQLSACQESGSVGDSIGNQGSEISVDTLQIDSLRVDSLNAYSGNHTYFSIGQFQDPLFGDVSVKALVRPSLPSYTEHSAINDSTQMELKLAINKGSVYGDTLSTEQFNLVQIGELWRAPARKFKDDIELGTKIASFSVGDEDTVRVPLPSDWVQKYGEYYNNNGDSTRSDEYRQNFHGFAIVPQNSGKIITVDPATSHILSLNKVAVDSTDSVSTDSLEISFGGYANSVERTNLPANNPDVSKLYSTLEHVLSFKFDFTSDEVDPLSIAKVDFIVYGNPDQLEESLDPLGSGVVRPDPGALQLYYIPGDELPASIDPGNSLTGGATYDEDDQAYHFNITPLVKSGYFDAVGSSLRFYIKSGSNIGIIRSNILYNNQLDQKSPKVIITSTNNR